MPGRKPSSLTDLALVAVFAGLIAAFTLAPAIPVGPVLVPITLQTLAVALTAMILGPWRGFAATSLYLLLGFVGLPVFAGGAAGLGVLVRPSAGYLLSFPIAALVIGYLARLFVRRYGTAGRRWLLLVAAGLVGALLVTHPLGILGMSINGHLPLGTAALADLAYIPGDIIKTVVAALVAVAVHRAFPDLFARPAAARDDRRAASRIG
ncbi:biotin transporter BioY [Propioniciclava coleopterorum]|uniref:Biotin transporter n=1 Tax=Propioniciclava coleopterorum TaxID=2714937 RepID=A0A6G7Y969_9ACTN|nr:biotin transporter BioY [Propioniciclava coleopterorum]QIK73226.1 biotin transporter BioY [Propioniciclava coleopterorum]